MQREIMKSSIIFHISSDVQCKKHTVLDLIQPHFPLLIRFIDNKNGNFLKPIQRHHKLQSQNSIVKYGNLR